MAANTDEEISPLNENNDQPKYPKIDTPEEDLKPGFECCIYKVPRRFRAGNEEAYTPHLISIGPIHYDDNNLAQMERQKRRCYKTFFQTTSYKERLKEFQEYVKNNLGKIRKCYEVQFIYKLEATQLIKTILRDAIFIIRLFLRDWIQKQKKSFGNDFDDDEEVDYYNNSALLRVELLTDLTLFENQIPFFVLEGLYKLAFLTSNKTSFLDLACSYFSIKKDPSFEEKEIKHFTDLIRYQVLEACSFNPCTGNHNIHSATRLREAGVKFKCSTVEEGLCVMFNGVSYTCYKIDDIEYEDVESIHKVRDASITYSLLQVQFDCDKGVLKLLTIDVEYETEIRFRNLMAFEQYCYPKKAYFCSYIKLLDSLIDTNEDVDLLVKAGIIVNKLGSNEAVAKMINNLAVGVVHSTLLYGEVGTKLNSYHKNSWNRRWTTLKYVYFNNLWRGTATVVAFIVVIFTLIQTVLAILEKAMPTK